MRAALPRLRSPKARPPCESRFQVPSKAGGRPSSGRNRRSSTSKKSCQRTPSSTSTMTRPRASWCVGSCCSCTWAQAPGLLMPAISRAVVRARRATRMQEPLPPGQDSAPIPFRLSSLDVDTRALPWSVRCYDPESKMLEAWHHFSPRSNPGRRAHLLLRFLMISLEFPFAHTTPERSLSSLLESLNRQPASGKVRP